MKSAEPAVLKSRWEANFGELMKKLYEYICIGELFLVKVAFVSLVLLVLGSQCVHASVLPLTYLSTWANTEMRKFYGITERGKSLSVY